MLSRNQKIALYMEGALDDLSGKMGFGVLRYSRNPVVCVIDSRFAGQDVTDVTRIPRRCPVVDSVESAVLLGAEVLVLGTAPSGGLIPQEWLPAIDSAVQSGLCIVNGLHDLLGTRYPDLQQGQWVWDIRLEPRGLGVGTAAASKLSNRRVLMVGTDMAVGKMTAGLELFVAAQRNGVSAEFIATGQVGITIMGSGVPLDAVRIDYACGAIEQQVMNVRDAELIIVEGQGSLIHPGSSANLPLLRGSCPTHLILCHRAGQETLYRVPSIRIPPLDIFLKMYEDLAVACGTFPRPRTVGVALNAGHLSAEEYKFWKNKTTLDVGLPVVDVVREGADRLLEAVMQN